MTSTSSTGFTLFSAVVCGLLIVNLAGAFHQQVELTAQQVETEHYSVTAKQKTQLMIAMLVGKVANASADETAITYHETAAKVISTYHFSDLQEKHNYQPMAAD